MKDWHDKSGRPSDFSHQQMVKDLHYLLDLPYTVYKSKSGFRYEEPVVGRKIMKSIVACMVAALHRGEEIVIRNFGTFRVEELRCYSTSNYILASDARGNILGRSPVKTAHRRKRGVVFYPSPQLMAMLNMHAPSVPNSKQRRVIRSWSE